MEAFHQRAVSFVPETRYLHWNTGFPAVTVCEKLDKAKIWDLAERLVFKVNLCELKLPYVRDTTRARNEIIMLVSLLKNTTVFKIILLKIMA
jgi:hypothetical protein